MADGNRRPNYDGCLGPPVFIGPGEPYEPPVSSNIHGFFAKGRGTGFRAGKTPKPYLSGGAVHDVEEADGGTRRAMAASKMSSKSFKNGGKGGGLFSDIRDTCPLGDTRGLQLGKSSSHKAGGPFKTDGEQRDPLGRGTGGLFGMPKHTGPLADNPLSKNPGTAKYKPLSTPWRTTKKKGSEFSKAPTLRGTDEVMVPQTDLGRYRTPLAMGGRGVFTDHKNLTGTLGKFPEAKPDPYVVPQNDKDYFNAGAAPKLRGGTFLTYKNQTRTGAADVASLEKPFVPPRRY